MLDHIPNREALGAADNLEAFTPPARTTPKEAIALELAERNLGEYYDFPKGRTELAEDIITAIRAAGYDIIQRVSQGDAWSPK